jgi:hypothetical protein
MGNTLAGKGREHEWKNGAVPAHGRTQNLKYGNLKADDADGWNCLYREGAQRAHAPMELMPGPAAQQTRTDAVINR